MRSLALSGALALALMSAPHVLAQDASTAELPSQVLFRPLELEPAAGDSLAALAIEAQQLAFPDGRDGRWFRLSWARRLAPASRATAAVDYVGVEGSDEFRYGGGRVEVDWSQGLGRLLTRRVGLDLGFSAPVGDAGLHPLSAQALAARMRLRTALVSMGRLELWVGATAQLVSPPGESARLEPADVYPGGVVAAFVPRWRSERVEAQLAVRVPMRTLPKATAFDLRVDVYTSRQLALRLGGTADIGGVDARRVDHAWTLGIVWRPPPAEGGRRASRPGRSRPGG